MKRLILLSVLLLPAGLGCLANEEPVTKTLVWPDGTRYVGGVFDGKRSGKGTIFWQDGTRFVGQFENDLRNGPGTMILPDGNVYTGFFKNDELIDSETMIASSNASDSVELDEQETASALGESELPVEADSISVEGIAAIEPSEPEVAYLVEQEAADYTYTESERVEESEPVEEDAPASADVTEITESVKDELIDTIDLWGAAWSDQNVPQYLSNYSSDFKVPGRQSRRTWDALRRTRLTRPSYIKLDFNYQRFEFVATNIVDVFFRQTYRSNTYSDLTDKVLRMRKEGTEWKILIERSR